MPDTDRLHEPFREYDSFRDLLDNINTERHTHELLSGVEGLGKEVEEELSERYNHLSHLEIGWMFMLYQAHRIE